MSVSTHAEIDECPRRWALSAANYAELWAGRGYPPKLRVAAMAGNVVHLALEIITKQLTRAGVPSLSDPSAPLVLKELGGYTRVVETSVERVLKRHVDNPRASGLFERAKSTLRAQIPILREQVQSMLSRLSVPNQAPADAAMTSTLTARGSARRTPLKNGSYPELEVHANRIRWRGNIDLLTVGDDAIEITDFKTGAPNEAHKAQIRAYAVMWWLDEELNPSRRVVDRLLLVYGSSRVEVIAPSISELDQLADELVARREKAEAELAIRPPVARPNTEWCRFCDVRQLCDTYWAGSTLWLSDDGRFGDIELELAGRRGPTSWDAVVTKARNVPAETMVLLRLQQAAEFRPGARLRILDCALARDAEDVAAPVAVTLSAFSEAYEVE